MRIEQTKLNIALARKSMSLTDLRQVVSADTLRRVTKGEHLRTKTIGRIAAALDVDVLEIIEAKGEAGNGKSD